MGRDEDRGADQPEPGSVVELRDDDVITGFSEGGRIPYWVNCGIYVLTDEAIARIKQILQATATNMTGRERYEVGAGHLNAQAAVAVAHALGEKKPAEEPFRASAGSRAEDVRADLLEIEAAKEACQRVRRLHAV